MAKIEKKVARIHTGSTFVGKGEERKAVPHFVEVSKESELRPEYTISGPVKSERDGANLYVTRDGNVLRFDADSGALVGERRSSA